MKRKLGLAISIALNCFLTVTVLLLLARSSQSDQAVHSAATSQSDRQTADSVRTGAAPHPDRVHQEIGPILQQARAAGISEAVLTEFLVADFNLKWQAGQNEFDGRYW